MIPINFDILKEKWNEYNLKDGSTLKTRMTLVAVFSEKDGNKKKYTFDCQQTNLVISPTLMGQQDPTTHTIESMRKHIEIQNCPYETISYEVNEYVLEDTTSLLISTNITNISRTSLHDRNGSRVYVVEVSGQITVKPFKSN